MTISIFETYTGAGIQAEKDIDSPKTLSFAIVADSATIDAMPEVKLHPDGDWLPAVTTPNLPNNEVKSTNGPVIAIRLNINALNAATTVNWQVCGERQ